MFAGAQFDDAAFSADAWFGGATFSGEITFEGAEFSTDAWFDGVTFSTASELVPLACAGTLDLSTRHLMLWGWIVALGMNLRVRASVPVLSGRAGRLPRCSVGFCRLLVSFRFLVPCLVLTVRRVLVPLGDRRCSFGRRPAFLGSVFTVGYCTVIMFGHRGFAVRLLRHLAVLVNGLRVCRFPPIRVSFRGRLFGVSGRGILLFGGHLPRGPLLVALLRVPLVLAPGTPFWAPARVPLLPFIPALTTGGGFRLTAVMGPGAR
ncbi:pentapeptide repeat-containing protein [Streptomyces sp. NPDC020096]